MTKHIQQGDVDLIVTSPLHDGDPANPQNGLAATTLLRIYRESDRYFWDFNDSSFKASGHGQITQAMALLDATNAPGVYYYAWTTPAADDTYHYIIQETSATAKNVPQVGEVLVGQWVDDIDAAISSRAVPGDQMALSAAGEVDVQSAMTTQGYTTTRAPYLDELAAANIPADVDTLLTRLTALRAANLDEITAVRLAELDAANLPADVDTLLTRLTALRAAALDEITAARLAELDAANLPADVDTLLARLTAGRAANLDDLDAPISTVLAAISTVLAAIGLLNDLSQADVQAAMTAQGYTAVRAGLLDFLDALISSRAAPGDAMDLVTDAVDAAALATTAIAEITGYLETSGPNPHGTGAWDGAGGLTAQQVRDAMKLAPTGGAPAAGSVDQSLDVIEEDTSTIEPIVSTNLDATISSIAAAIAALNNLSIAGVQSALTAQGYTTGRALLLDNLNASISSVLSAIAALNNLSIADVQTALTAQGYTSVRALLLNNLDAAISSVISAIAALNDISAADVDAQLSATHGAGSWEPALEIRVVKQNYSYNPVADELVGNVWVEQMGTVVTNPDDLTVNCYDEDGTLQFTETDLTPDANGFFKITKAAPGFASNKAYYMVVEVVGVWGTLQAGKGIFTVG